MELSEKRARFLKHISGELRMPLNVIKGISDIWKDEIYDIKSVKEGFAKVEECSERLLSIVNDIVDYSAIENHELQFQMEPFNLKDLVSNMLASMYTDVKKQNKRFDVYVHDVTEELLYGDAHRVEQILACMMHNENKYTGPQEKIQLNIFQTELVGNRVSFRFELTCTSKNIYRNLSETINNKVMTDNTDLAIYNGYFILKEMGGDIHIDVDDNGHSQIIVTMHFDRVERENSENEHKEFAKEKVLLICDTKEEAEERGKILEEMGILFESATDTDEALDTIGRAENEGFPFSLCVIDWGKKSFDMRNFANDVRTIFGPDYIVVAMVYDAQNHIEEVKQLGIPCVVEKTWFRSTVAEMFMNAKKQENLMQNQKFHELHKYDFHGRNVLVAEDAPLNMEVIKKILKEANLTVSSAVDGYDAVTNYMNKPEGYFSCILLDINMPKLNGYEAAKRIREANREDASKVPIFALTANAFQSDIREALESGMDGHFAKPLNVPVFYKTLQRIFNEEGRINYKDKEELLAVEEEYDPLTGLLNRYGFEKRIMSSDYVNRPVGFMYLSIDNFKEVLTMYGKKVGEAILIKIAKLLKEMLRSSDLVVRIPGDEFVIVLNNYTGDSEFIQRKIGEINETLLYSKDELPKVSISAGVAFSKRGYSKKLCNLADEALYQVKQNGGKGCNVVEDYTEDTVESTFEAVWNRSIYGSELYYLEHDNGALMDKKEEYLKLILGKNQSIGIICGYFTEGFPVYSISGFALESLGYDFESFEKETDKKLESLVYEEDLKVLYEGVHDEELETRKIRFIHRNGNVLWFSVTHVNSVASDGRKIWIASIRSVDDSMVGILCDMDYATVSLIYCNDNMVIFEKGAEQSYLAKLNLRKKYNYESLFTNVFSKMQPESDQDEYLSLTNLENIKFHLEAKGIYEFVTYQYMEDGHSEPVRYKYRYLNREKDIILWTQEYVADFAEKDDITSLYNEKGFKRKIRKILSDKNNINKQYTLLYFDVKNLKSWNEMLGYANGNQLLRQIAEQIMESGLMPIMGARFAVDSFWLLISSDNLDYEKIITLCHKKLDVNGNSLTIHMHCGVYSIKDKNQNVESMCDRAMIAETHITNEYATPYYVYDGQAEEAYKNQIFVLNNLERAFEHNEFQVYYQPVCDVKTRKIVSAEALVRWRQVGGKLISPGVFIPVMEQKGYISQLDIFMADNVQAFLEKRKEQEQIYVPVSMNISRMDFLNEQFMKRLRDNNERTTLDREYLRYEVTESAFINVGQDGNSLLDEFRKNGSKIYVDDFGTGYSSLENLLEIQFDVLKIDMIFIRKIGCNIIAEDIIKATIIGCHDLGKKVIAEGVETEEQYQFLLSAGCDYIQGYYFSKPLPQDEFEQFLNKHA